MKSSRSKLSLTKIGVSRNIIASVSTLNMTDRGFLTLQKEETLLRGSLDNLTDPALLYSVGDKGFTIRFLDTDQMELVELIKCRPTEIEQNNILHFVTDLNNRHPLPIEMDHYKQTETLYDNIQDHLPSREYKHIVFVLGAGASMDVLPGGGDLLRKMYEKDPEGNAQQFIADVFKVDYGGVHYPSFNQVLNIIDIALEREEGFSSWYSLAALRDLKKQLISDLRSYMIEQAEEATVNSYAILAEQLKDFYNHGGRVSFISLNYDLFLDNALEQTFGKDALNYVLSFHGSDGKQIIANAPQGTENEQHPIDIIKLHGSLDWMICPTCFEPAKYAGRDLIKSLAVRKCTEDRTELQEFLFPPTRERVEVHSHWISLQHEADQLLRKADKAVFIGFSLSEDDAHFRFKLKKHLYRSENPVYIQVVGRSKDQFDIASDRTAQNYWQFFGPIDYRPSGFRDFAQSPY